MILLDLKQRPLPIEDLLLVAAEEPVLLRSLDGQEYVLELAGDLDREVMQLAENKEFMEFLYERAREPASVSLAALRERLGGAEQE